MVTFDPIGKVISENGRFFIELDKKFAGAALGLDEFSHIQVVWWFNMYDSEETRNCFVSEKPYKNGPERIGVLATRGNVRPNPIAITACELIGYDKISGRLEVAYIDAENGTPVLDIKPYHPSADRVRDVRMPEWCAHWPDCYEEGGNFDWGSVFNF